ncbi:hypothetical protein HOL59_01005 [Candidatus Woesearchaeota archaeon]|jgi:methionyl-tRNA formyltransferase|nr:hypothetical protein [Candidatus Woesearchaeota archaeon]
MKDIIVFTQNTMASIVATREVLINNSDRIKAIVLASQFKGESFTDQLKVAYKLTKKSSFSFFFYKLLESKVYNYLLWGHKLIKTKNYQNDSAKTIEDLAGQYNIPIIKTTNLSDNDFLINIKELNPTFVLCLVAQILRKNVFETLGNKLINAHGSYLPEYRGAAQYFWYLFNGDRQYGVTVHFMEAGLDTGDIIFQRKFDYNQNVSMYELHHKLATSFGFMLNEFINNYANDNDDDHNNELISFKQDEEKATMTRMPTKEDFSQLKKKGNKLITFKDFFKYI